MAPTRFPSGVTNVSPASDTYMLGFPDPTLWHTWFDDFDKYTAADWEVTEVDTDGDGAVGIATIDGKGGLLAVGVEADELDSTYLQWTGLSGASAARETFKFTAGKKMIFKARWKVSDATDTAVVIGLHNDDTAPAAVTDGVRFYKADTDATLNLIVEKNSTETSVEVGEIANDTFVVTTFYYDGKSKIEAFLNGARVGTGAVTNIPDDEELAIGFGIANGAEGAETLTVDYIFVAEER